MEIERDAGLRSWEVFGEDGVESKVFYDKFPEGYPVNAEFYVISAMDGDVRKNKLVISDTLIRKLSIHAK